MLTSIENIPNWTRSAGGHPIELFRSNRKDATQRPILFLGGIHGDEPEGIWLAESTLEWLKFHENKNHAAWCLIPCLNPDGFAKNERVNANGVDLNRNFPEKNWSEFHTQPRYYPGSQPASEPEVKALIKLIDEINPRIVIHCHSWKPCIILTGDREIEIAQTFSRHSGYEFKQDIGYPTPGSLGEYGWRERGIPVICVEVEEKIDRKNIEPLFRKSIEEIFVLGKRP